MTDKERIFHYLNGQLSKSSFRKWLIASDKLSELFGSDATTLKELVDKFSLTGKIHEILNKHIDKSEFNQFKIKVYIDKNCKLGQDPIELIRHLSSIADLLPSKSLINKISILNKSTLNMPTMKEAKIWNHNSFVENRKTLPDLTPKIIETFEEVANIISTGNFKNVT